MKIATSGSWSFEGFQHIRESFQTVRAALGEGHPITAIRGGGAKVADALAVRLAEHEGLPFHEIKADGPRMERPLVQRGTPISLPLPMFSWPFLWASRKAHAVALSWLSRLENVSLSLNHHRPRNPDFPERHEPLRIE